MSLILVLLRAKVGIWGIGGEQNPGLSVQSNYDSVRTNAEPVLPLCDSCLVALKADQSVSQMQSQDNF